MNIFCKHTKKNKGMTYIEIIVVLSIFAIISSITLFNYRKFQEKVDMKTLANNIALKFVQAQKDSMSGKLPSATQQPPSPSTWKPSYGFSFSGPFPTTSFVSFVDLTQDKVLDDFLCRAFECLERINITNNISITGVTAYYQAGGSSALTDLNVTYTRPDSVATFRSSTNLTSTVSYVQISLSSPQAVTSNIKIYASGRIQIN